MTMPAILSEELTATIVEILSSPNDEKDGLLTSVPPPPVPTPPATPPLAGAGLAGYNLAYAQLGAAAAASGPSGAGLSAYNAGYVALGAAPAPLSPTASTNSPLRQVPASPGAQPYKLPVQQPKPGENRLVKSLESDYVEQNRKALAELGRRDADLEKDRSAVRYLNDQKREKYRVDVGTLMTRSGAPFDTYTVKQKYAAVAGQFIPATRTDAQNMEWCNQSLIWVCVGDPKGSEKPRFFSHVGKVGRFHHSSFNRGGGVIGAGEWIIKDGALKKVSPTSGHYKPGMDFLYHAVLQLAVAFRDQAVDGGTTIFLYDTTDHTWVDYPVKEFIKAPTAGGRLSTHD